MKEIVSVIIPSYGGGTMIERCVDSVLNQTYPYVEVIVVDDNGLGTPEQQSTQNALKKYVNDSRVKYVCHSVNRNGSAARNTGVKNSTGNYIALLDDDDIYYPTNIEEHMKVLPYLSDEYALTYCGLDEYVKDQRIREVQRSFSGQDLYKILMHRVVIGSTSMCIRKSAWEKIGGFDESFRRHQDWEFSARIMAYYKVCALSHIGSRRYLEFRNTPKNPWVAIENRKYYIDKMQPLISTLSVKQQKDVVVYNKLDAIFELFKNRYYRDYAKEYFKLRPGYRGVVFFLRRLYKIASRGYGQIKF